jgi:hypothetical protein
MSPSGNKGIVSVFARSRESECSGCGSGRGVYKRKQKGGISEQNMSFPGALTEPGFWYGLLFSGREAISCTELRAPPRLGPVDEGFGLCRISLALESEFDAEEFDCGGDGVRVEMETGCNRLVSVEVDGGNGRYRSTVVGSDGVWKVGTGPVP